MRGGLRAAAFIFCVMFLSLVLGAHFTKLYLGERVSNMLSTAAWNALVFLTMYLASEPYVRRYWPLPLISWQRLVDGQWRDSLVARDVAGGLLIGTFSALKDRLFVLLVHHGPPAVSPPFLSSLGSSGQAVSWVLHVPGEALSYALGALFGVLLARVFIKRGVIYFPIFAASLALAMAPRSGNDVVDFINGLIGAVLMLAALHEGGILMVALAWGSYHLLQGLPLTLDFGAWYAGGATLTAVALIAIVAYAFSCTVARGRALASAPATT